jgi:GlpG protein
MRKICEQLDKPTASRFLNYLDSLGIEGDIQEDDRQISIWILDEVKLDQARSAWKIFEQNPTVATTSRLSSYVQASRSEKPKRRIRPVAIHLGHHGYVTVILVLISVGATLLSLTPSLRHLTSVLYFSEFIGPGAPEIRAGEVWRLFTPMFIHGGWIHLIFNMMWVLQIGTQIEREVGSLFLLVFTLVVAALCHISQFLISGPLFVGFSGVVYGYLGYAWMMTKYKPSQNFQLSSDTVAMMLIWLGLCIVGIIPNVANAEHLTGLALGTGWGYLQSQGFKTDWRRWKFRRKM